MPMPSSRQTRLSADQSKLFFGEVFLPYMLGGSLVGSVVAVAMYFRVFAN